MNTMTAEVLSDAISFVVEHQPAGRKFEVGDVTAELRAAATTYAQTWQADPKHWANNFMLDMRSNAKYDAPTATTGYKGSKGLSAGQIKGILNVIRAEQSKKAPAPKATVATAVAEVLNVSQVRTARFRVVPDDGQSIAVRLSVPTMWTDAPKGTRKLSVRAQDGWMTVGKVEPDGSVKVFKKAGEALEKRVRQALNILAKADDDLVYILDYAMEGGHCGFCDLELDTAESLSVGYGPTCAKKHNLPWGEKAVPAKVLLAKADYDIQHDTDGAVVSLAGFKLRPSVFSEADDLAAAADLANDQAVGN
jgi:hypothetical protein